MTTPNKLFAADLHFGHSNIIKYSKRPFASIEEMDETLIANWNAKVTNQDVVYLLGDVSFHKHMEDTVKLVKRLNGNITLVKGNHDDRVLMKLLMANRAVNFVKDYYEIGEEINGRREKFALMHYPMQEWRGSHHGSIHLHGHCHGTMNNEGLLRMDVGVDCTGYTPISLDEVMVQINEKRARIESGEEISIHDWASRAKGFNELYRLAEDDYLQFMADHLKYKEFYDERSSAVPS